MAREEEVKHAAYAQYCNSESICFALLCNSFKQGAEWADKNIYISSIWNDINIVPSDNKGIIYLTKNDKIGVIKAIKSNNWDWYVTDKYSIIKWAYISDLLPKGCEK